MEARDAHPEGEQGQENGPPMNEQQQTTEGSVSVKVAVRVRPLSLNEKTQGCRPVLKLQQRTVDAGADRLFEFDKVYGPGAAQVRD
jgi:hypothetical protein